MKSRLINGTFLPWVAVLALLTAGALMSAGLAQSAVTSGTQVSGSIAEQLMGNSTKALAEYSYYTMADQYYHKGREHFEESAFKDVFQRFKDEIAPAGIVHLKGKEMKESLAWMRMAMSLDPGNVEYAIVASYWLDREVGRPDLAFQALDEAAALNPDSYLVYLGRGRIFAKINKIEECRQAFEIALKLWPGTGNPEDPDVRLHRREILSYLAVLAELDGNNIAAAAHLREVIRMYPEKSKAVRSQLDRIEQGGSTAEIAVQTWNSLRSEARYTDEHDHAGHAETGQHE